MGSREKSNSSTATERLRVGLDELLEHPGCDRRNTEVPPNASSKLPVESFIDGDNFVVQIRWPGVDPENIDLEVADEILKIKASLFRNKIRYGSFEKAISLPPGVKAEHLNAVHQNGVLELRAAIPGKVSGKAIKVEVEEKNPPDEKER
jgi:HSP20 family protein